MSRIAGLWHQAFAYLYLHLASGSAKEHKGRVGRTGKAEKTMRLGKDGTAKAGKAVEAEKPGLIL